MGTKCDHKIVPAPKDSWRAKRTESRKRLKHLRRKYMASRRSNRRRA